jgi:hypothetical protein
VFDDADTSHLVYAVAHEVGHHAGFEDVNSSNAPGCDSSDTVMLSPWTGGMPSGMTSADYAAASNSYPEPPPPPDPYTIPCDWTCGPSPIVLSFDGFYPELSPAEVAFDIRNDGYPPIIGWTAARTPSAFLVLDRDGDGMISRGAELFGNFTPVGSGLIGPRANNGFEALAWFDRPEAGGNGNGMIDPGDAVFGRLRLWFDLNHAGYSSPDELRTLSDAHVLWLSIHARSWGRQDPYGNKFRYGAPFAVTTGTDIRVRMAFDVYFTVLQ